MLHPRKEHNGDKTRITRNGKQGKEGATQVCYHVVPRRAHERSNERPACATNRNQRRCGTDQGAGRGIGKRAPTHACLFLHREYNGTTTNNTRKGVGTGRETQAHHGMARRGRSVRTHVDKSATAGMLYPATPQRTWCQRCTTKAHIPPPFLLSHRAQRERKPAKRKTETHTRAEAGKKCMPGRRAGREKGKERQRHERNKG